MNFQLQRRTQQANARWRTVVRFTAYQMERIERVVQELLAVDSRLMFRVVTDDDKQHVLTYCIDGVWRNHP